MQAFFYILIAFAPILAIAQDNTIKIRLDASDAPHRLYHIQMTMPAKAGPMTLLYPEWIPGEHGPTGPITDLVGLKITANGQTIPWKRDGVEHVRISPHRPQWKRFCFGRVRFHFASRFGRLFFRIFGNQQLAVLNWNQFLLYPQGVPADQLQYQAALRVPNSWRYGTALPIAREAGSEIEFQPFRSRPSSTRRCRQAPTIGPSSLPPKVPSLITYIWPETAIAPSKFRRIKLIITKAWSQRREPCSGRGIIAAIIFCSR